MGRRPVNVFPWEGVWWKVQPLQAIATAWESVWYKVQPTQAIATAWESVWYKVQPTQASHSLGGCVVQGAANSG